MSLQSKVKVKADNYCAQGLPGTNLAAIIYPESISNNLLHFSLEGLGHGVEPK